MQINNVKIAESKKSATAANIIKNICNHTLNSVPRTVKAIKTGKLQGEKISITKNSGKIGTFFNKRAAVLSNIFKNSNPIDIPILFSALAMPIPCPFTAPAAFAAGCILISPILIKKMATKEVTIAQIKDIYNKLKTKDYIQLDESLKRNTKQYNI